MTCGGCGQDHETDTGKRLRRQTGGVFFRKEICDAVGNVNT